MARFTFALMMLTAVILQGLLFPDVLAIRILPNIALVLILCWSASVGAGEGAIWAAMTGLLFDALSLDPMGANGIAFLAVALLGASSGKRFFQASILPPIPIAFVATWFYALIILIIRASDSGGAPLSALAPLIFLQALLNSFLVVPIYPLTRLLSRSIARAK
jgi:rod shape-determining protein MreD